MQGIDATIDELPLEPRREAGEGGWAARRALLIAAAAGGLGALAALTLHARQAAAPADGHTRAADAPARVAADPDRLFGLVIVEPEWRTSDADLTASPPTLASLGLETSSPSALFPPPQETNPPAAVPPAPSASLPPVVPLPPVRNVPRIDDTAPLPPARPPEFAEPAPNLAPSAPRVAQPSAPPSDDRNIFQKLLGIGQQPGAVVASRPPTVRPEVAPGPQSSPPPTTATKTPSGEARSGLAALLFGGFSSGPNLDRLGYDRQTAIYDISARALYLPDGTRIEAHSGLGPALDDPRYVSERAVGPTPPHLYELTMRESLFHGVQAIRLTPVGDGDVYGRAGLLAHPYMLGPNGDSNGCVSVKDYEAFLRAYQSGQINKLAVVGRI